MLYLRFSYGVNKEKSDFGRFTYALNLDDKIVRYSKPYFINDLDNRPNIGGEMQTIDVATLKSIPNHKSAKWIFPNNLMKKKMKNIDEFQRLFDKSTEESNPIIQFLKLK